MSTTNVLVTSKAIWYAMRASGVVSLLLLSGVMVLGTATVGRWRPAGQPRFVTASLHRTVSLLAVVFVAVHVATALLDPYAAVGVASVVVPFAGAANAFWVGFGTVSLDLIAALIVTSLLRRHVPARVWRAVHWCAYLCWPVAVAHTLGLGSDAGALWLQTLTALCIAGVVVAVARRVTYVKRGKHLELQEAAA